MERKTLIRVVVALTFVTATAQAERVQWSPAEGGNGHFYEAVHAPAGIFWSQAMAAAQAAGGHLATITSAEENAFVYHLITDTQYWNQNRWGPWFGGFQPKASPEPAGNWRWVTGEPFVYTNWTAAQPDNLGSDECCLHFGAAYGKVKLSTWNDLPDEYTYAPIRGYIVEFESPMIIYVDDDAAGANNGTSWADAYMYLQDALMMASAGDEIRVAQGVYRPDQFALSDRPNLGRVETFQLKNGVAVRGGYPGVGKSDPNARDTTRYHTVLSGDRKGNDRTLARPYDMGDDPSRLDNSYHVVTATGTDSTAVLDGFVVTAGYADATGGQMDGGGMLICQADPTVTNCTFTGNWALNYGAGLCAEPNSCPIVSNCFFTANSSTDGAGVDNEYSNPTFIRCSFVGNWVWEYNADTYGGAGMYNFHSSPILINCLFAANGAPGWGAGGAIRNNEGNPTLINCTICGNYSDGDGAGIYNGWQSNPRLVNCILWNNKSRGGGGPAAQIWGNAPSVEYCCIEGWTEQLGGTNNIALDPLFAHQGYWDPNTTPDQPWDDLPTDGDYHLKSLAGRWDPNSGEWIKDNVTSPCIDAGDPMSPIGYESFPNGGRINMGDYGGTAEASKSYFGEPVCETIVAGDINGDCRIDFTDFAIMALHWLADHSP